MSSNTDNSYSNKEFNVIPKANYFENDQNIDGQTPSNTPSNKKGEKLQFDMSKFSNVYDKLNKFQEESDDEIEEDFQKNHSKFNKEDYIDD